MARDIPSFTEKGVRIVSLEVLLCRYKDHDVLIIDLNE